MTAPALEDADEVPAAIAESIGSWGRVMRKAHDENARGLLHNAAADLFRTRRVNKAVWPRSDGVVTQAITNSLAAWAEAAGIEADDAQSIFAQAQRDEPRENGNGHALEPPPVMGPEEYGTAVATIDHRPVAINPAEFITPATWPDEAPPPVDWLAGGRIPRADVTTLHGDGGTGKTDVATLLATNCARGAQEWLGHEIAKGPAVFISAEEPSDAIWRRVWSHAKRDGYPMRSVTDLHLWFPAETGDSVMALPDRSGIMRPTKLMHSIVKRIAALAPVFVGVDNVAATYGGSQVDRLMVRSYVNLWRAVAHGPGRPAVLLLDHPSLSGLTTGSGRSGNMDWRNSVRAALYMRNADDKAEADRGVKILETVKNNYGPLGNAVRLVWGDCGFQLEQAPSSHHRAAMDAECDETFLRLLDERNAQGRYVSDKSGKNYAPSVFAAMSRNEGFTAKAFARAMDRLFETRRITLRAERIDGKPRNVIDRASTTPSGGA